MRKIDVTRQYIELIGPQGPLFDKPEYPFFIGSRGKCVLNFRSVLSFVWLEVAYNLKINRHIYK